MDSAFIGFQKGVSKGGFAPFAQENKEQLAAELTAEVGNRERSRSPPRGGASTAAEAAMEAEKATQRHPFPWALAPQYQE